MPRDERPPYFPFYPYDFASDGVVEAMSTESVGAYILLLCKAWSEEPAGSIPNNDVVLARWSRLKDNDWARCKPEVLAAFTLGTDDRWHQKRLRAEYQKVRGIQRSRVKAGKAGADARWQTHGKRITEGIPRNEYEGEGETPGEGEGEGGGGPPPLTAKGVVIPPSLRVPSFLEAWDEWEAHLREKHIRTTSLADRRQLKKCETWGPEFAVVCIQHSVAGNYQGVFEPKGAGSNGAGSTAAERKRSQVAIALEKRLSR